MSWYSGGASLGSCHACGWPVHDGGQSGAYCSNDRCRNGYWGGKPRPRLVDPAAARAREAERAASFHASMAAIGATPVIEDPQPSTPFQRSCQLADRKGRPHLWRVQGAWRVTHPVNPRDQSFTVPAMDWAVDRNHREGRP